MNESPSIMRRTSNNRGIGVIAFETLSNPTMTSAASRGRLVSRPVVILDCRQP